MIGIYIITCQVTNMQYVGKSIDVERRLHHHFNLNSSGCKLLHQSFLDYGIENFSYEIIECHSCISEIELIALERKYIRDLNTLTPNGYNANKGGAGQPCSEETKQKMSKAKKGKKLGKRSKESIEKQKAFYRKNGHHNLGKSHTRESKDKISESKKQYLRDNPELRKTLSENGKKGAKARWG